MPLPPKILWKRISKSESIKKGFDFYFSQAKADRAVGFIEKFLTHSKGRWAGQPFILMDWQKKEVIEELFGWMRCDTDRRRFKIGYIELPKKSGKSTLISAICLYLLLEGEPAAEVYGCATSRDQAGIVAKQMFEIVRASPFLSSRLDIIESRKTIAHVATSSFFRVLASESHTAEGLNLHACAYDELHSVKDRRLWDALRYGGISRTESLILAITTAGSSRDTICWEQHEYAMKVSADPGYDPTFFPYVRGATIEDDFRDPEVHKAANPSYGVTMDAETFAADVAEAEKSNSKLASFLRYRLNIWVQGENRFLKPHQLVECMGVSENLAPDRVWHVGVDLAQTWDTNAFCAVSKDFSGTYDCIFKFWIPQDNAHHRDITDGIPYTQYSKDPKIGLTLTPGDTCDYAFIERDILAFCRDRTVSTIAFDPHNSHFLVQRLQAEGLNVVGYSQSFATMNAPTMLLSTLVSDGKLRLNDNPIAHSHLLNASTRTNADGYIKIVKPSANSPHRVDGAIALVMALALAESSEAAPKRPEPEVFVL